MSIRNILVIIADDPEPEAALAPATALAEAHGAHVTALALTQMPEADYGYAYGTYGSIATGQMMAERMAEARERVEKTAEELRMHLARTAISSEVRSAARSFSGIAEEVAHHGRCADLIMLTRAGEDYTDSHDKAIDGALFDSGRTLALLPSGWSTGFGARIVVAWDGSREAARAVAGAMPLIETASEVRIALVAPRAGDPEHGEEPGADLGTALARHNDNVSVDRLPSLDRPASQVLLQHASDSNADLLVLGAYGHSRLSETLFGGVTHDMLREAPLPLLMAH